MSSEITQIIPNNIQLTKSEFQKLLFLSNALEEGWSIKKSGDNYIFTKKHEGRREIFQSDYLNKFIQTNIDVKQILHKLF